jgi:hypothetical protein
LLLVRRHALDIVAVISLVSLGILLCGQFVSAGARYEKKTGVCYLIVEAHRGYFTVDWGYTSYFATNNYRLPLGSLDIHTWFSWAWPDASNALWYFAAGPTAAPGYYIVFPLWCLILPCTIAPMLWLRRRRRRAARGFAVEAAGDSSC